MSRKISKKNIAPLIMTAILLILITVSAVWIIYNEKSKGETVTIVSNGVTVWTGDLSSVNEELIVTVISDPSDEKSPYVIEGNSPRGSHYNVVRITREGVSIIDSNCANRICIHEGITNSPAKPIVCLPNRLMITVTGKAHDTDAITY
ncbi:MAG: NusG domain II-containing protein [Lachnospiraceae bacterium]|nr:NusG domain II-containing protein [Lachnospiraceae bacterium]